MCAKLKKELETLWMVGIKQWVVFVFLTLPNETNALLWKFLEKGGMDYVERIKRLS